jgi:hypothetical protein
MKLLMGWVVPVAEMAIAPKRLLKKIQFPRKGYPQSRRWQFRAMVLAA